MSAEHWENEVIRLTGLLQEAEVEVAALRAALSQRERNAVATPGLIAACDNQDMKTLNELNENPVVREWDDLTLETRYAVARGGMKAGDKIHLVRTEVVLENRSSRPGGAAVGSLLSSTRVCNGNGKYTARPVAGWDTDRVTCGLCRGER